MLKKRASYLGASVYESNPIKIQKSLRLSQCNKDEIISYFNQTEPPILVGNEPIDNVINSFTKTVIEVMKKINQCIAK